MKKQKNIVMSRTATSMVLSVRLDRSIKRDDDALGLARHAESQAFDDKEQERRAADRDRQIGHADRQRWKIGDAVLPGGRDQLFTVNDHEQSHGRDQKLGQKLREPAQLRRKHLNEERHV